MSDEQFKELCKAIRAVAEAIGGVMLVLALLFLGGCGGCFTIHH